MLMTLICSVAGHKIDRHRVWNDTINFRTNCTRCNVSLLRANNGWREFNPDSDHNIARRAHPRSGAS